MNLELFHLLFQRLKKDQDQQKPYQKDNQHHSEPVELQIKQADKLKGKNARQTMLQLQVLVLGLLG